MYGCSLVVLEEVLVWSLLVEIRGVDLLCKRFGCGYPVLEESNLWSSCVRRGMGVDFLCLKSQSFGPPVIQKAWV